MSKPTLEDVRQTLETARTHIETKWVRSTWFTWVDVNDTKSDGEDVPEGATVTGVCLAGSVLYSLDYLDEQWTDKAKVVPVIEALFDNLPKRSKARKNYDAWQEACVVEGQERPAKQIYDEKLQAIIAFNDQRGRSKQEVLDLFDRTIKDVVARTAPNIEEQP